MVPNIAKSPPFQMGELVLRIVAAAEHNSNKLHSPWYSFGTIQRKEASRFLATLWKALIRQSLFYPLASLDVSGQWPVFV